MRVLIFKKSGGSGITFQKETVTKGLIRTFKSSLIYITIIGGLVLYEYFIGRSWIIELTSCILLLMLVFGSSTWKKDYLTKEEIKDFIDKM